MRQFGNIAAGVWLALMPPGLAQAEPVVVVELFTSQGCSSCPPADAFLAEIAEHKDVIALALHVDYWDYIGWKDTFASPAFTQRQYDYATVAGSRTVYTPQFVIGGAEHVIGNNPSEILQTIRSQLAHSTGVTVAVTEGGGRVNVTADTEGALPKGTTVQIIHYISEAPVKIERGENAGRTVTYHNIVTSTETLGTWDGARTFAATARRDSNPIVVVVQEPGPGRILAAARLR